MRYILSFVKVLLINIYQRWCYSIETKFLCSTRAQGLVAMRVAFAAVTWLPTRVTIPTVDADMRRTVALVEPFTAILILVASLAEAFSVLKVEPGLVVVLVISRTIVSETVRFYQIAPTYMLLISFRAGTIRSAANTIRTRYGLCHIPILIRYDKTVHDLRFQNQEFWISTAKWMFWVDLYSESNKY